MGTLAEAIWIAKGFLQFGSPEAKEMLEEMGEDDEDVEEIDQLSTLEGKAEVFSHAVDNHPHTNQS